MPLASAMALAMAWSATTLIGLVSPLILRLCGNKGTQALERLMGLMLILIAARMCLDGISFVRP
ncbi:MAG: hypothetical protein NTW21_27690 [Verrucomicrobia bacterium]|nr:hypothetical protein [Verrucomicrobiota bacterium]